MSVEETVSLSTFASDASGTETPRQVVIPRQLGPVRLLREIGRGAMGVVWLARDNMLSRDVAVKFLLHFQPQPGDPQLARFIDGARAAAAVRHENLLTLYQADLASGVPYLIMEYVDGPSLSQLIRSAGAVPLPAALAILESVAAALELLHERAIVHRDVKPANVLLDSQGRVCLADFGLACPRRTSDAAGAASLAGTPAYMAPEAFDGAVTPRCDVYALGVCAFELLAGALPFSATTWKEVRDMHRAAPLPLEKLRQRGIQEAFIEVVERALNKSPVFRYKSALAFRRGLSDAVQQVFKKKPPQSDLVSLVASVRKGDPGGDSPTSTAPTPTIQGTYFDRLSELADKKRQGRPGT